MNLDFLPTILTPEIGIQICEHASDMDYVGHSTDRLKTPACFYHLFAEQAAPNQRVTGVVQQVDVQFALRVVDKNATLPQTREAIFNALLNYTPAGAMAPITFVKGEVVDVQKSMIWFRDIFTTTVIRQSI